MVTISAEGETLATVESERMKVRHAGRDVTGEGNPDVVVGTWWAGSYTGVATHVYDLGPTLTQVLDAPTVQTDPAADSDVPCLSYGEFSDLDGDGSAEFVTCDDAEFEYFGAASTNPYAENRNLVIVAVLDYEPGQGYVPAGHRFPELYAGNIEMYTREAEIETAEAPYDRTSRSLWALVALTMSHLYSGQPARAWEELDRLYAGEDKEFLWAQILHVASGSPFYQPSGHFPDVPLPDYYRLELVPGCAEAVDCLAERDEAEPTCELGRWLAQQFTRVWGWPVAILKEGKQVGDEGVPVRNLAWLGVALDRLGVLRDDESLVLGAPEEGGGCALEIVQRVDGDEQRVAGIALDPPGRAPGAVCRLELDGSLGPAWRLRGDLTWEELPPP